MIPNSKPGRPTPDDIQTGRLIELFADAEAIGARHWTVTLWRTNPDGSWSQQPVVLVEGEPAFMADTPAEYATHITQLHARWERGELLWGPFRTTAGQFLDESERPKA